MKTYSIGVESMMLKAEWVPDDDALKLILNGATTKKHVSL